MFRFFLFFFVLSKYLKKKERKYSTRGKITITESNKKRTRSYHIFNLDVSSLSLSLSIYLSPSLPCPFIKNSHCEREDSNSATDKWVNTHKIASSMQSRRYTSEQDRAIHGKASPFFSSALGRVCKWKASVPGSPRYIYQSQGYTISIYSVYIYTFD